MVTLFRSSISFIVFYLILQDIFQKKPDVLSCNNSVLRQCRNEMFYSSEEVFPFHWGILPILKGLSFERKHVCRNYLMLHYRGRMFLPTTTKFFRLIEMLKITIKTWKLYDSRNPLVSNRQSVI